MKRTSTLLVAVLAAFALPVLAQTATPPAKDPAATPASTSVRPTPAAAHRSGVKSGELTGKETARLEKGQAHVQTMEDKAKADGKLTPKERERTPWRTTTKAKDPSPEA
ncbi:MAG: hypothetical protein IPK39_24125 [Sulfuritalea sp.]|nr:hypothetical protein [Sulfuritalea sp.]